MGIKMSKKVNLNNFDEWSDLEKQLAVLINLYREENKPKSIIARILGKTSVPDLIPDKNLYNKAKQRNQIQTTRPKISHEGVEEMFLELSNLGYSKSAELIAYGYTHPKLVLEAWVYNDNQKEILLRNDFKYIGVSILKDKDKSYFSVVLSK